jgi:hypothetical protein
MNSAFFPPVLLIVMSLFSWNAFPRRLARDVANAEITPQQGRDYAFMYRGWSVAFAVAGATLTLMTFAGR